MDNTSANYCLYTVYSILSCNWIDKKMEKSVTIAKAKMIYTFDVRYKANITIKTCLYMN